MCLAPHIASSRGMRLLIRCVPSPLFLHCAHLNIPSRLLVQKFTASGLKLLGWLHAYTCLSHVDDRPPLFSFIILVRVKPSDRGRRTPSIDTTIPLFHFNSSHARSSPVSSPFPSQKRLQCEFNALYPPYAPHYAACGTVSALLCRAAPPFLGFLLNVQACAGIAGVMRGGTLPDKRGCMRSGSSVCISALRLQSS